MTQATAERVSAQIFEPVFEGVEPTKRGNILVSGICRALDDVRSLRLTKIDNIMDIDLRTREIRSTQLAGYIINMAKVRGTNWVQFHEASWLAKVDGEVLHLNNGRHRSGAYKTEELGSYETPEQLFAAYDRQENLYSKSSPRGWTQPDIFTAEGLQKLAVLLNGQGEVVDGKEDNK